jgi:uncharacterized damage-inducible protein DinB
MRLTLSLVAALATIAATTPADAQTIASDPNPVVGTARSEWESLAGYIQKAAEQMPESDYSFKPTPEVRSFGQLIGHLAGGQFLICAAALGEKSTTAEDEIEKTKSAKADLVAAFRASTEFCKRAYAQTDAETTGMTKLFGSDRTRLAALVRNTVHDGEHYGNIVTYMRLKGMVPPSSQPTPPSR